MNRREIFLAAGAALAGTTMVSAGRAFSQTAATTSPYGLPISSDFPFTKKPANVLESTMAYVDEGEPQDVVDTITANGQWLTTSEIPKLFFYGSPGAINPEPAVQWLIANVPNMETRFVGAGMHFIQEDHPEIIGRGITDWLRRI